MTRFSIQNSAWWRPLFLLFGVTGDRSYVEVDDTSLRVRFGWYRLTVPRERITGTARVNWALWRGIGWRSNLRNAIGLIGRSGPVVYLRIAPPVPTRLLGIPIKLTHLYLSVDTPDAFIASLGGGSAPLPELGAETRVRTGGG